MTSDALNTYYGTTHAHKGTNNTHPEKNSLDADASAMFASARREGFDFLFLTEHTGDGFSGDPASSWNSSRAAARDASENGVFAAFSGYEYSDNYGPDGGHITTVGTPDFITSTPET
ncbi:MAG: hypothetical protein WBG57_13985, partial [Ornithinimicrobium sp.]